MTTCGYAATEGSSRVVHLKGSSRRTHRLSRHDRRRRGSMVLSDLQGIRRTRPRRRVLATQQEA
jgi:hypothetical protein